MNIVDINPKLNMWSDMKISKLSQNEIEIISKIIINLLLALS